MDSEYPGRFRVFEHIITHAFNELDDLAEGIPHMEESLLGKIDIACRKEDYILLARGQKPKMKRTKDLIRALHIKNGIYRLFSGIDPFEGIL